MLERKKVISRLENWRKTCPFEKCAHCGAKGKCTNPTFDDVLTLLKEEDEGIEPEISRKSVTETTASLWYKCGACGEAIEQGDDEFCRHCGKKVKWVE